MDAFKSIFKGGAAIPGMAISKQVRGAIGDSIKKPAVASLAKGDVKGALHLDRAKTIGRNLKDTWGG